MQPHYATLRQSPDAILQTIVAGDLCNHTMQRCKPIACKSFADIIIGSSKLFFINIILSLKNIPFGNCKKKKPFKQNKLFKGPVSASQAKLRLSFLFLVSLFQCSYENRDGKASHDTVSNMVLY